MTSLLPYWWWALPVLLLPLWWHRRKRQRPDAVPLATARFLPAAPPAQVRVWRWRDPWLLLVRCLLLATLVAWLAATIFPWRGDTVLVDAGADQQWVTQQIAQAGMNSARRMELPAGSLAWLRRHERDWRDDARLLVLARSGVVGMPATPPQFSHRVELRTAPAAPPASTVSPAPHTGAWSRHVVLAAPAPRDAAWRALFAAFDMAGSNAPAAPSALQTLAASPQPTTRLIVWDTPGALPPAGWRAPHWWIADAALFARLLPAGARPISIRLDGLTWRYADSTRGRLWTADVMPPRDVDAARALYESWRAFDAAPAPAYPAPAQVFAATARAPAAADVRPATAIALALLALFCLERILTHARRG